MKSRDGYRLTKSTKTVLSILIKSTKTVLSILVILVALLMAVYAYAINQTRLTHNAYFLNILKSTKKANRTVVISPITSVAYFHGAQTTTQLNGMSVTSKSIAIKIPPINSRYQHLEQQPNISIHSDSNSLFVNSSKPWDNRIYAQLSYVPPDYNPVNSKLKTILFPYQPGPGHEFYGIFAGRQTFIENKCKVEKCEITHNMDRLTEADIIILQDPASLDSTRILDQMKKTERRYNQIWSFYSHESPPHFMEHMGVDVEFNWTMTYSASSTVPAVYDSYFEVHSPEKRPELRKNYSTGKTGQVAWIVSNCKTANKREKYAQELAKFIQVDIFGACGKPICGDYLGNCMMDVLNTYKFYLSFENTNCDTYVTEKYFHTALRNDILPIVMGAKPDYYRKVSPPNSFIHVDNFASPRALAAYLHRLDQHDDLYNQYFHWKGKWKYVPSTTFVCRLCAMLHAPQRTLVTTVDEWKKSDHCRRVGRYKWSTGYQTSSTRTVVHLTVSSGFCLLLVCAIHAQAH